MSSDLSYFSQDHNFGLLHSPLPCRELPQLPTIAKKGSHNREQRIYGIVEVLEQARIASAQMGLGWRGWFVDSALAPPLQQPQQTDRINSSLSSVAARPQSPIGRDNLDKAIVTCGPTPTPMTPPRESIIHNVSGSDCSCGPKNDMKICGASIQFDIITPSLSGKLPSRLHKIRSHTRSTRMRVLSCEDTRKRRASTRENAVIYLNILSPGLGDVFDVEFDRQERRMKDLLHSRGLDVRHIGPMKFACSLCGKIFQQHKHVSRHAAKHLDEPVFDCPWCSMGFTRADSLFRHVSLYCRSLDR